MKAIFCCETGNRGAGKSSLINKLVQGSGLENAKVGMNECTMKTKFFDITSLVKNKPVIYSKVFLVDQPG